VTRRGWIVIAVIAVALFAIVVGGFLWPRPQFRKGPWTGNVPIESLPADSG
jgi:hypothetical protein